MANPAPGVNINVTAAAPNNPGTNPTGNWFVIGNASGPGNVAIPVNSMTDFTNSFGRIVNGTLTGRYAVTPGSVTLDSTALYDALDTFFREGGNSAFVSLLAPASGGTAASATLGTNSFTAISVGTWANSASGNAAGLVISVTNTTINTTTVYTASIAYNGVTLASSPALSGESDIRNWINGLPAYQRLVTVSAQAGSSALPSANSTTSIYFTSGADAATADSDTPAALAAFVDTYGPGQVSYPGAYSATVWANLTNHASANNRIAVLDVNPARTATQLATDVNTLQASGADVTRAGIFGPWLIVPGTSAAYFNRTVAPSALAAAKMSVNDQSNDCNVPAAGLTNGAARYASNVAVTYSASDRALLNNNGVNVIRLVPTTNTIAVYGFRTASFDPNWTYLNNSRMRMQLIYAFDRVAETYVFSQIDGRGQIFARFGGALAGVCQNYWMRGSLYGATSNAAFSVNTGKTVNTPATIAAGQLNAQVSLKMSPFAEYVTVNVTKYLSNAALPQ